MIDGAPRRHTTAKPTFADRVRAWWQSRSAPAFDPGWEALLHDRFDEWPRLSDGERDRMRDLIAAFMAATNWEASRDFAVTDEMAVLIAAQACLLLLGLDLDAYPHRPTVIVHPSTVVLHGRRGVGVGRVEADGPQRIDGQANFRGPVVVSWRAVDAGLRWPERGTNVVYHEFAHVLDMLDGTVDGTPPLDDAAARARWIEVCTTAYEHVRDGDEPSVLRSYAGVNPGEFFAVATEVFFTQPVALRDEEPDLYRELVGFYRQDPASRRSTP